MAQQQERVVVQVSCGDCSGTGLYKNSSDSEETATVCTKCNGSCATTITYTPYMGRQLREGVTTIRESAGKYAPPTGKTMTYKEFDAKFPAAEVTA